MLLSRCLICSVKGLGKITCNYCAQHWAQSITGLVHQAHQTDWRLLSAAKLHGIWTWCDVIQDPLSIFLRGLSCCRPAVACLFPLSRDSPLIKLALDWGVGKEVKLSAQEAEVTDTLTNFVLIAFAIVEELWGLMPGTLIGSAFFSVLHINWILQCQALGFTFSSLPLWIWRSTVLFCCCFL